MITRETQGLTGVSENFIEAHSLRYGLPGLYKIGNALEAMHGGPDNKTHFVQVLQP